MRQTQYAHQTTNTKKQYKAAKPKKLFKITISLDKAI